MERIDENTVKLTDDEQIIGSFYKWLREERGMHMTDAAVFLQEMPAKARNVLQGEFLLYLEDMDDDVTLSASHTEVSIMEYSREGIASDIKAAREQAARFGGQDTRSP